MCALAGCNLFEMPDRIYPTTASEPTPIPGAGNANRKAKEGGERMETTETSEATKPRETARTSEAAKPEETAPTDAPTKPAEATHTSAPPPPPDVKLQSARSEFTGKVVLLGEGYRLRLLDSEKIVSLTRAKRADRFQIEQINLRKYYEKTLVVRGTLEQDWIWGAEVVGQWLKPGERRSANQLAPPVKEQ